MIVTEVKKLKYDSNCKKNPVFITWLNTLTGWEQWLFDTTYIDGLTTARSETFEGYINDLITANSKVQDVKINAQASLTVFALIPRGYFRSKNFIVFFILQNAIKPYDMAN